jgi:hypothetical protein
VTEYFLHVSWGGWYTRGSKVHQQRFRLKMYISKAFNWFDRTRTVILSHSCRSYLVENRNNPGHNFFNIIIVSWMPIANYRLKTGVSLKLCYPVVYNHRRDRQEWDRITVRVRSNQLKALDIYILSRNLCWWTFDPRVYHPPQETCKKYSAIGIHLTIMILKKLWPGLFRFSTKYDRHCILIALRNMTAIVLLLPY